MNTFNTEIDVDWNRFFGSLGYWWAALKSGAPQHCLAPRWIDAVPRHDLVFSIGLLLNNQRRHRHRRKLTAALSP
jgi:hypothetical protein